MPEQYFTAAPTSAHETHAFSYEYRGKTLRFLTDAGVFSKARVDAGTALLLSALPERFTGRALDLGCGWGAVGACMASAWTGADIWLTDVNARATALAAQNLTQNGLSGEVRTGDGFDAVQGRFDLIALNPPIRAGKRAVYALFDGAAARLTANGALYVVIRKQQGADSAKKYLSTIFARVSTIARGAGFHVLRCEKEARVDMASAPDRQ